MKSKIDWKHKLASRKFWAMVVGFVTPVLFMLNVSETVVENVTSIIMAGASIVAYVLAEGYVDANK